MLYLAFEEKFAAYLHVASLSILIWDILDNVKNDYRLLFRHRLELPKVVYFLSRISVLGFAVASTIFLTTPSVECKAFKASFLVFFISGLVFTLYLSYLRVCAVWHWNRYIIGLFGALWSSVLISCFTAINSIKGVEVESYCQEAVVGLNIMAPVIISFVNHTFVFLAITYGVCRNTIGRDLTFRDCIQLMLGKSLPTFSKALLHDSQVCYIITMLVAATTIVWFYVWLEVQPTSAFRIMIAPPYVVLMNILICRVFRNTKLGVYKNKASLPSNNRQTHASPNSIPWKSRYGDTTNSACSPGTPIQIAVSQVVECKSDYPPPKRSQLPVELDFGMV